MSRKIDQAIKQISSQINWENWEAEDRVSDEAKKYMKVTDVLSSRLDWIADRYNEELGGDEEEHLDTLEMVQQLLEAIDSKNN